MPSTAAKNTKREPQCLSTFSKRTLSVKAQRLSTLEKEGFTFQRRRSTSLSSLLLLISQPLLRIKILGTKSSYLNFATLAKMSFPRNSALPWASKRRRSLSTPSFIQIGLNANLRSTMSTLFRRISSTLTRFSFRKASSSLSVSLTFLFSS